MPDLTSNSPPRPTLSWLVVVLLSVALTAWMWPQHGLTGRYFPNTAWAGRPEVERVDAAVNSPLLATPPANEWQTYSIEWTASLLVWSPGEYRIATRSAAGSDVSIDGEMVVDNPGALPMALKDARVRLDRGVHTLRVRYAQTSERVTCDLLWASADGGLTPMSSARLLPRRTTLVRAVAVHLAAVLTGLVAVLLGRGAIAWIHRRARSRHAAWRRVVEALTEPSTAVSVLWAVGGAVRIAAIAAGRPVLWADSYVFHATAADILRGYVTSHDAFRTLAYPFLMAAFLRHDSGATWAALVALQHLLGLVAATIFYGVARRVVSPHVALGAALAFAVNGLTVFYEASLLTETLFIVTLAGVCWMALHLLARPSLGRAVATGISCGLLVLVRPVAQWHVGVVVLAIWLTRISWRRRAAVSVAVVVAMVVTVWPMRVINEREFGFHGIALGAGLGLYTRVFEVDGLAPPDPSSEPLVRSQWAKAQLLGWSAPRVRDVLDFDFELSTAQVDERMQRLALETIAAHPLTFAVASARQWVQQMASPQHGAVWCGAGPQSYPCSGDGPEPRRPFRLLGVDPSPLRRIVTAYLVRGEWPMWPVLLLACVGGWTLLRRSWTHAARPETWFLVGTALYYTLVPSLSQWPQDRYRLPVDAIVFMLALHGARVSAPRVQATAGQTRAA